MGNEAAQVLKLVLISFMNLRYFFWSDSNFKPIICCQFMDLFKSHFLLYESIEIKCAAAAFLSQSTDKRK